MQLHDWPPTVFIWRIVSQIVCHSVIANIEILMHLGWRSREVDEVPVQFVWRWSCDANDWLKDGKRVFVVSSDMLRQAATVEKVTTASSKFAWDVSAIVVRGQEHCAEGGKSGLNFLRLD
jgi:hypothetical protein